MSPPHRSRPIKWRTTGIVLVIGASRQNTAFVGAKFRWSAPVPLSFQVAAMRNGVPSCSPC
jgi:hypothetical protein